MTDKHPVTLLNWNIVDFENGEAIFVGLRSMPANYVMQHNDSEGWFRLDCSFRSSTPIDSFDKHSGVGHTRSGRHYVLLGRPSDNSGLIRHSVARMFADSNYRFRYAFDDETSH